MSNLILGIGDLGASNTPGTVIKTFALGSCVAVVLLDPRTRTIGMAHVALPDSKVNPTRAQERPGYFADSAIPNLLREMGRLGATNPQGLYAKLAGGASIMDQNATFNIGRRNLEAVRSLLARLGIRTVGEDVGGTISRTVSLSVNTGKLTLASPGRPDWEI
ncbi:chemoreceptor glutamine deamidase CheD [Desulfuromonas versatilis]|uniref:Probable chemoreceptor glutamine deamidase CheD n=1 Tax=Desulfuromonas versatilis TaxID=2802975 RepID=A0ABN6E2S6_9BACT|nr:chemotaxis protein CheD [Desulfuromonas versatilis]BCR06648.1 chemoreceptor glutamine deamidase CheD [Desulfuromonas versatilis]